MLFDNMKNDFSISLQDFEKMNAEIEKYKTNIESLNTDNVLFFSQEDIRYIRRF